MSASRSKGPLRRAQLIAPFGVGAMTILPDGTSVICTGLDFWYKRKGGADSSGDVVISEFVAREWRLERRLEVEHFRIPPDHRSRWNSAAETPNVELTIPFLRFPRFHFCPSCHYLDERSMWERGSIACSRCAAKGNTRFLIQVPIIAMCERGHIQDFPWREWVHEDLEPDCDLPMRLIATGGASLSAQRVICDCGKERSLGQVMGKDLSVTTRGSTPVHKCMGNKPWLGPDAKESCDCDLRGSLRSASSVYFAQVRSAIYLPRAMDAVPNELMEVLSAPPVSTILNAMQDSDDLTPSFLREAFPNQLRPFTLEQIAIALSRLESGEDDAVQADASVDGDDVETGFRRAEFSALSRKRNDDLLQIRHIEIGSYGSSISQFFSQVMLIDKLRETRALLGFTRVYPETDQSNDQLKSLMWKSPPAFNQWLPAYLVYGEGLFFRLNEKRLQEWERRDAVRARVERLVASYRSVQQDRRLKDRNLAPRFVLLHTLSHLLLNQLTFDCGYSSASLRERLYVSENENAPMAGILIYTAAGDSEGTMGGLVRMGRPGNLEPLLQRALTSARWCSADPVCMEMGARGGQGPDSCNLAACHSCALVPETACEEFNRFLDRALLIGDHHNSSLAFFDV